MVQDDYYFTLGDNRDNSKDSRYWGFGPHANVLGVAKRIYWSWDRHAKWVRWERIGQDIREPTGSTDTTPNKGVQPTPYSVRCAPASRRG